MKIKSKRNVKMAPIKVNTPISEIVEKFQNAFAQVNKMLVNRTEELESFKYCLLTRGHLMLKGPPGVAKSLLARLAFKVIKPDEDLVTFKIQMMANTQAEQLFGPMSIKKLREEEIIHYNTTGMMPRAHLAYIDEVYHAPDSVLMVLMGILNERTFFNGTTQDKCPLISAIGTGNFVSESHELKAFQDRWLITRDVAPADSNSARLKILEAFLEDIDEDGVEISDAITLSELRRLQAATKEVEVPEEVRALYSEMVHKYSTSAQLNGDGYVSDRRFCQAFRVIQASVLLGTGGEGNIAAKSEYVTAAKYAILQSSSKDHREAMDTAIASVIGEFERESQEEPDIARLETIANTYLKRYDPNNALDIKVKQYKKISDGLDKINESAPEQQFTIPRNVERVKRVVKKLQELRETLREELQGVPPAFLAQNGVTLKQP